GEEQAVAAVGGVLDDVAGLLQPLLHEAGDLGVVLDQQDAHRGSSAVAGKVARFRAAPKPGGRGGPGRPSGRRSSLPPAIRPPARRRPASARRARRPSADLDPELALPPVPPHGQAHGPAGGHRGDVAHQGARAVHPLALDRDHHVAGTEAGARRRAAALHPRDEPDLGARRQPAGLDGLRPTWIRNSRSRPSRRTVRRTVRPGGTAATLRTRVRELSTRSPSIATTTSPARRPARAAGLPRSTPAMST